MGNGIANNIKMNNCYKCNCCDSYTENIQKEYSPPNGNNINNVITLEENDKYNSLFSIQNEKIIFKNKFKKIFFEKNVSSMTN